jgi:predicted amidohydrolase YtcJ
MSQPVVSLVALAMLLCSVGAHAAEREAAATVPMSKPADLIFTNGKIRTPDGWAEAMTVNDGVITFVGRDAAALAGRGPATQVIDLGGDVVLPGLHDSHLHALRSGLEQYACAFPAGARPEAIAAQVKACAVTMKPGQWVLGGDWVASTFRAGQQTKAFLDKVSPDHPVRLSDESHHSAWVNSRALAVARITRDTPNPSGGAIERDARGEPTGILRETAMDLVDRKVPEPSVAEKRASLILATNQMLSYGITSFTDAGVTEENIGTFASLAEDGLLKQRVRGCIRWPAAPAGARMAAETLIETRANYSRGRFKLDCVKVVLDGVPTESRTAAMLEPYAHSTLHGDADAKGMLMFPQTLLNEGAARFDRQGLIMKFHAAGDAAVRAAIDAVAYVRQVNGDAGPSHDVAHANFVNTADLPRVRALNMTWEFSPYVWYPASVDNNGIRQVIGDERMRRWTPIKDGLASGALVVAGSDWSVVPSVNPWLAIETMMTRQTPGGSPTMVGEDQRISLDDALRIFTVNGAIHQGHRSVVGSIEPGMLADVIVLDRNPYEAPPTQIHTTKVKLTFIAGEKVFDAANPPGLVAH